jgi:hypothetical protein
VEPTTDEGGTWQRGVLRQRRFRHGRPVRMALFTSNSATGGTPRMAWPPGGYGALTSRPGTEREKTGGSRVTEILE